jgi:hypothetical protein
MSPRFVVTEIEGYRIGGGWKKPSGLPGLSVSVIDTAYNFAEIARFDSESQRKGAGEGKGRGGCCSREEAFERIRNRAHGLAAILEAEHAA